MKNPLQYIDSSTTLFFAFLMLFLGLRALPLGANHVSTDERNKFNSEMFLLLNPDSISTCQDKKVPRDSKIGYLP